MKQNTMPLDNKTNMGTIKACQETRKTIGNSMGLPFSIKI